MKLYFYLLAALAIIMFIPLKPEAAGPITGKWRLVDPGKDNQGNPCPFIPDTMEFFKDSTVEMSNMHGMKMKFKAKVTADEAKAVMTRFPIIKDPKTILLMMPLHEQDWSNRAMAYKYSVGKKELKLEVEGWSPSRYERTK